MRYAITLMTAALVVTLSAPAARAAEKIPSERVRIGDLDLSKKEDTVILDRRLRAAARRICYQNVYHGTLGGAWHAQCVRTAVDKAHADIAARRTLLAAKPAQEVQADRSRTSKCVGDCSPAFFSVP